MRLTAQERAAIKDAVRLADPDAQVYLFGSRADDNLRGGDLDLLVLSNRVSLAEKTEILIRLKDALGEQKIDLLVKKPSEANRDPFVASVMTSAVLL